MSVRIPIINDPLERLRKNTLWVKGKNPYSGSPLPDNVRTGQYLLICPKCGSSRFYFDKKKDMFCCSSCKAKWSRVE